MYTGEEDPLTLQTAPAPTGSRLKAGALCTDVTNAQKETIVARHRHATFVQECRHVGKAIQTRSYIA